MRFRKIRVLCVFVATLTASVLVGCRESKKLTTPEMYKYNNFDAEIYDLNGSANSRSSDKSHSATVINIATFRIIDSRYPRAFFRLRSDNYYNGGFGQSVMTDSFVYNHRPGDIVHFDFIDSARVFHVNR